MAYCLKTWPCALGLAAAVACASGKDLFESAEGDSEGSAGSSGARGPAAGGATSAGVAGAGGRAAGDGSGGVSASAGERATADVGEESAGGVANIPEDAVCAASDAAGAAGQSGKLTLELKANTAELASLPRGEVIISNRSDGVVPLADLVLRYFIESEYSDALTARLRVLVDYAEVRGALSYRAIASVQGQMLLAQSPVKGANAYAQIVFPPSAGTLESNEHVLVQFRLAAPDGDGAYYAVAVDQTNDYSFGACSLHAAPWERIALLNEGQLVAGTSPIDDRLDAADGGAGGGGGQSGQGGDAGFDSAGAAGTDGGGAGGASG